MQLILLQKVVNLGNLGDKVDVKPGYGRNFLGHTGEFEVVVHMHADVESKVKVVVVPDAA